VVTAGGGLARVDGGDPGDEDDAKLTTSNKQRTASITVTDSSVRRTT
jgi:hypothetical protein